MRKKTSTEQQAAEVNPVLEEGKHAIWWNRFWRRATVAINLCGIFLVFLSLYFRGFLLAFLVVIAFVILDRFASRRWNHWKQEMNRVGGQLREESS